MVRITPPDGADWTLDVRFEAGRVALVLAFDLAGAWTCVTLALDRPDSRVLARAILAAGGDATERTFTSRAGAAGG